MYGCATHCLGPGCSFWHECEQICATEKNLCPRCNMISEDEVSDRVTPTNTP